MNRQINLERVLWDTFSDFGLENQLLTIVQRKYVKVAMKRAINQALEILSEYNSKIDNGSELLQSEQEKVQLQIE